MAYTGQHTAESLRVLSVLTNQSRNCILSDLCQQMLVYYIRVPMETWKMKVVTEKSWNKKNWPKVMEFCYRSWNFTSFVRELYPICMLFATTYANEGLM